MPDYYLPKKISSITASDSKVAIIGNVSEVSGNSFILDDGTGKIEIASDQAVENGELIRVFCSSVDGKLKADVIQSLKGFDLNLFKKIEELYSKEGLSV
jgi:hypothetical protein